MRSIFIDRRTAGRSLLDIVQTSFRLSRKNALQALRQRQVTICGGVCLDPERRVKAGQHIQLDAKPAKPTRSSVSPLAKQIILRHVDEHLLIVEKPAGLTTVRHADEVQGRAGKFLPPTLVDLVPSVLDRCGERRTGRIRAVHRIDKETSGLVVLARTPEAERHLGQQFRAHTVGRRYLALVRGQARDARIESTLLPDRGDGRRGSTAGEGQHAVTTVRVVEKLGVFTLVECELETGRTHQVRIHLGEAGTPLCGERVYDRPLHGKPAPDESGANRPLLHAAYLSVEHPATEKRMEWSAKLPRDMEQIASKLRAQFRPGDKQQ
jgi:23S rRNA pseudouridine1911/1915/1917 synthase